MALGNVMIENAKIGFRNFSGKKGAYNAEGNRNFCVFLDSAMADAMVKDGWNVKFLKPRDPDDVPQPYIQISVSYANVPPRVVLVTKKNKTVLEEDTVSALDYAEIENVDLVINPYQWNVNGKTGVKAYLKTMYVTIYEDEFESKYADVPDSAKNVEDDEDAPF